MEKLLPDTNSSDADRVVLVLDKVIQFSLFTFVAFSMFSISVTQVSFAIGALSWLLKVHLTRTWKELRGTWVGIAILCFCLAYILTIITSVDLASSLKLLKKFLQFIIFFWVANTVQDAKQRDLLVALVIVAAAVAAMNGLLPLLISPERLYGGARTIGTMSAPSTFSGILMIIGLLALGRLLFQKPKKYWLLGSIGIIGLCLLMSMTRQAWLGFFVGSIFLLLLSNKKYLLIFPLLLMVVLLFSSEQIADRMHSLIKLKDSSLHARMSLWGGGWKTFRDHPVTGCGYKCVDSVYSQYPDPSGWIAHYRGMHSNIFQLLADTGIVGLGSWALIWVAYFIEIFKRWRALAGEKSQDNAAGILMGSSAAVLAFLVGGFFESSVYDSEVTMLLYFVMGISLTKVKKLPH